MPRPKFRRATIINAVICLAEAHSAWDADRGQISAKECLDTTLSYRGADQFVRDVITELLRRGKAWYTAEGRADNEEYEETNCLEIAAFEAMNLPEMKD